MAQSYFQIERDSRLCGKMNAENSKKSPSGNLGAEWENKKAIPETSGNGIK